MPDKISINFILLLLLVSFFSSESIAQLPSKRDIYLNYIDIYAPVAIREMNQFHIPASITLSQGLIESGAGKSELAVKANNHFGIKCHDGWNGATYSQNDDAPNECFRKYKTAEESFRDHSLFLTQRSRYATLFKLKIIDYKGWANGLKQAGYATNPRYADMLIKVIEDYELSKYDRFDGMTPLEIRKKEKVLKNATVYEYYNPAYEQPGVENFTYVADDKSGRKVYINNDILFVFAGKGDSFLSIGSDMNVRARKLARFNEMKRNEPLIGGQVVYIEKKKLNGIRDSYTVMPYDSWYSISQFTGIQQRALKEFNPSFGDAVPPPGTKLQLKGKVKRTFLERLFGKN